MPYFDPYSFEYLNLYHKNVFLPKKWLPLKGRFLQKFNIDKNPINESYVRILAELDHFWHFFGHFSILGDLCHLGAIWEKGPKLTKMA